MTSPSADAFRALARSSPWLWRTVRFTARWAGTHARPPVRAWLRRPDALRVESLGGDLVHVVRAKRRGMAVLTLHGGRSVALPRPGDAGPTAPTFRPDGLVAQRPRDWLDTDAPIYVDYFWVATLDPVELADCDEGPGTVVENVAEVDHFGRPAWEALVRATEVYRPRCSCCSLLRTRETDLDYGDDRLIVEYPEAYRVRLDVGTGVCVLTEAIGGEPMPVTGHQLRIEEVDGPMDDQLFVRASDSRFGRP